MLGYVARINVNGLTSTIWKGDWQPGVGNRLKTMINLVTIGFIAEPGLYFACQPDLILTGQMFTVDDDLEVRPLAPSHFFSPPTPNFSTWPPH